MNDTTTIASRETGAPLVAVTFGNVVANPETGKTAPTQRVSQLLEGLRVVVSQGQPTNNTQLNYENRLTVVRLGIATSLFLALRAKHAPTSSHSLRVALICSAWAQRLGLDPLDRDRIEVGALLHDIGKIGVPDQILRKPGKLTVEEQLVMDGCAAASCEILAGCSNDPDLLDIVRLSSVWFNSRRASDLARGDALPLGARLLSIANAYDSMTTEHVYRRAMTQDHALNELIRGGNSQFDANLALDFSRMMSEQPEMLQLVVRDRWLHQLKGNELHDFWQASRNAACIVPANQSQEQFFFHQLVSEISDGVAFTDSQGVVLRWNETLEHLTGVPAAAACGKVWNSEQLNLISTETLSTDECLVQNCIHGGSPDERSMVTTTKQGERIPVVVRACPVTGTAPGRFGSIVIVRSLADRQNYEQRLQTLHQQITLDPLTGVSNRAELNRRLRELVDQATAGGPTFSILICDIDHFKRVNDVHGHPAGDEALIRFAGILSQFARQDDLVARYGGEEFVVLTVHCDCPTAVSRAESIRRALETTPLPSLGNASVTASFGVTQFQSGDTADSVLARADRALLRAKDTGRNRVMHFGSGLMAVPEVTPRAGWLNWFDSKGKTRDREVDILTPVPVELAIEKLKGFIADHTAEIIAVSENQVSLKMNASGSTSGRRRVDMQISLQVMLTLSEYKSPGQLPREASKTRVHALIKPVRGRDRRRSELGVCTDNVVSSLRSYLMGEMLDATLVKPTSVG